MRKNLKELQHESVPDIVDLSALEEGEVVAEDEDEVGGEDEVMDEEVLSDKEQVLDVAMNPGGAPTQPLLQYTLSIDQLLLYLLAS